MPTWCCSSSPGSTRPPSSGCTPRPAGSASPCSSRCTTPTRSQRALDVGATLIGVNARNLKTLEVDPSAFERIAPSLPADVVAVAESGITGPDDVRRVVAAGADAVLVGEALVRGGDPRAAVAAMVDAGASETRPPRS